MSEDASDVTKALAAFGAPSIRYHSFGQSHARPSNITMPRRPGTVVVPPPGETAPVVTQQDEPVAAPEFAMASRLAPQPAPMPPIAPRPAPIVAEAHPAPLFPVNTGVAPPARPLAEWAAPVSSVPVRPMVAPPVPAPAVPGPESHYTAPPLSQMNPPPAPPMTPAVPMPAPISYPSPPTPAFGGASRVGTVSSISGLAEVFEFLAAS